METQHSRDLRSLRNSTGGDAFLLFGTTKKDKPEAFSEWITCPKRDGRIKRQREKQAKGEKSCCACHFARNTLRSGNIVSKALAKGSFEKPPRAVRSTLRRGLRGMIELVLSSLCVSGTLAMDARAWVRDHEARGGHSTMPCPDCKEGGEPASASAKGSDMEDVFSSSEPPLAVLARSSLLAYDNDGGVALAERTARDAVDFLHEHGLVELREDEGPGSRSSSSSSSSSSNDGDSGTARHDRSLLIDATDLGHAVHRGGWLTTRDALIVQRYLRSAPNAIVCNSEDKYNGAARESLREHKRAMRTDTDDPSFSLHPAVPLQLLFLTAPLRPKSNFQKWDALHRQTFGNGAKLFRLSLAEKAALRAVGLVPKDLLLVQDVAIRDCNCKDWHPGKAQELKRALFQRPEFADTVEEARALHECIQGDCRFRTAKREVLSRELETNRDTARGQAAHLALDHSWTGAPRQRHVCWGCAL